MFLFRTVWGSGWLIGNTVGLVSKMRGGKYLPILEPDSLSGHRSRDLVVDLLHRLLVQQDLSIANAGQ